MKDRDFELSAPRAEDVGEIAALLHASLVDWYERRLRQGHRFGGSVEPFRLIAEVYAALDPGEGWLARGGAGEGLLGVCYLHPRETHVAVGIVATAPAAAGRGVARAMMERALERARREGKPLRLVSSLLNLDSFSLYTRLGLVPRQMFQDLELAVPAAGMSAPPPPGLERLRLAREADLDPLADLEFSLQGIRRRRDLEFFLRNEAGDWRLWMAEGADGAPRGWLAASHDPLCGMLGPGVAADETVAEALLWRALDARRGSTAVFLVPCDASALVRACYAWGARNVELHCSQVLGHSPPTRGLAFPTFLPESG